MQRDVTNAYYEWHVHTATHDASRFFYASVHTNEKAQWARLESWSWFCSKKQRWRSPVHLLLDRTSPPSCTCMVVETPEAAIQSVRPQTRAGPSSHCRHTTARPGHALRPVEKKGWYVKCIKMYALTMVMYTWHWQTSQVQIHRHSGDHTWNRWN